ncbi:hypothetical protein AB1Y20_011977 [Prymnesium parvum]|uniref:Glycosyl transferase family 25 domain-containing protein n=1 Tax=Prymnesium parvum TaxID=97485 RepID=A0AB34IN38_PRYPA
MRYTILLLLVVAHDASCKLYSQGTTTPFFVISLSKKRARSVIESLRNVTTHVEHVPAVHGNVSAHEYVFHMAQYHHLMRRNTASELGCALSHVHALKRADEYCNAHGCDMAVVMEDDVSTELLPFWSTSINKLTHNLPDSWAVVQVANCCHCLSTELDTTKSYDH